MAERARRGLLPCPTAARWPPLPTLQLPNRCCSGGRRRPGAAPGQTLPEPAGPIPVQSESGLRDTACRHVPPCRDTGPHDQGRSGIPISFPTFQHLSAPVALPRNGRHAPAQVGFPAPEVQRNGVAANGFGQRPRIDAYRSSLNTNFPAELRGHLPRGRLNPRVRNRTRKRSPGRHAHTSATVAARLPLRSSAGRPPCIVAWQRPLIAAGGA